MATHIQAHTTWPYACETRNETRKCDDNLKSICEVGWSGRCTGASCLLLKFLLSIKSWCSESNMSADKGVICTSDASHMEWAEARHVSAGEGALITTVALRIVHTTTIRTRTFGVLRIRLRVRNCSGRRLAHLVLAPAAGRSLAPFVIAPAAGRLAAGRLVVLVLAPAGRGRLAGTQFGGGLLALVRLAGTRFGGGLLFGGGRLVLVSSCAHAVWW